MSDLNGSKSMELYLRQPEEEIQIESIATDMLILDGKNNISLNCENDDIDVIIAEVSNGSEINKSEATKKITFCLDKEFQKVNIKSKDINPTYLNEISPICFYNKCDGTSKPNIQSNIFEANKNIKVNGSENLKCFREFDYKNSKTNKCIPQNEKRISKKIRSDQSGSQSKFCQNYALNEKQPTLLKSQSLDLYKEDCSTFIGHQQLYNRLLPNIAENQSYTKTEPSAKNHLEKTINDAHEQPSNRTTLYQSSESRPIYPNVPYSPYGSPYGSPGSIRRRPPLRESRRISIEKSGSFLQLNQYKLMDQIGQGSYGLVKLAYSEEDSTHYAMKILSKKRLLRQAAFMRRGPRQTTNNTPLDRVYREIAVLKKLDHPNVVKLVEVLDDPIEDSLYMVFELVQKGEVLSIPTNNPLSENRAWNVLRDCILGLEYLHYQKIIHADIKPGNLLLTECGRVKIADLGVCNEFIGEDAIMSNSTGGTPAFRAPETLVLGKNVYCGRAADIWALGATLYSLVYGNVPFIANSIPLLYEKIKNEPVDFRESPEISEHLRACILKMLEKDPTRRITLPQLKIDPWVTNNGSHCLQTEDENCCLVQVDDDDINSVVRSIPKLDTLILIKTMLKKHSFGNPFMKSNSGKDPQPGGSRIEKFVKAGRSNSAPGSYHMIIDREPSLDNVLPSLSEHCFDQNQ